MAIDIYFDGDCYFCDNFVKKLELEKVYGKVNLYSLRDDISVKNKIQRLGFNVNNGFLVHYNKNWYWGDEAYKIVNLNTHKKGFKNFNINKIISKIPYKFLVLGRYITLVVQGIGLIDLTHKDNENSIFAKSIRFSLLFLFFISFFQLVFLSNNIKEGGFLSLFLIYLSYLSYSNVRFLKKIKNYFYSQSIKFWLGYISFILIILNAIPTISLSRISLFFLTLPLIFYFYERYKSEKNNRNSKIGIFLMCILLFCTIPGLHIAPFFSGISGWYVQVDKSKNFTTAAYVLTNNNYEKVVLNHALLEPGTQLGRLEGAWHNSGRSKEDFMQFLFDNYSRLYPIIKTGKLSHQRVLGSLAYPAHSFSDTDASIYKNFAPENIISITETYYEVDWDGVIASQKDYPPLNLKVK